MRLRLLALVLAAQLSSGCFVLDEIDKGNEIMDAHSPTRSAAAKAKKAEEEAAKTGAAQTGEDGEPKKSWWEGARTISSADKAPTDNPHVRCVIAGKERFTLQSDCLSQGGKLKSSH